MIVNGLLMLQTENVCKMFMNILCLISMTLFLIRLKN